MLRTRTDLWRLALFTSLGLFPNACGGESAGDNDNPSEHRTDEGADAAVNSGPGIPDAGSAPSLDASSSPATDAGAEAGTDVGSTTMDPAPDGAAPNPSSGTDGGTPNGTQCSDLVHGTVYTGLKQCDDGVVHRPNAAHVCPSMLPRTAAEAADRAPPNDEPWSADNECESDANCTKAAHGHCEFSAGESLPIKECIYGCVSDADCGSDEVCVCGNPVGACVPATCRDDDDCSTGMKCAQWYDANITCGPSAVLTCQTPGDECATDTDCNADEDSFCSGASGVRQCETHPREVCGRPFVVAGCARLAELTRSEGWVAQASLNPPSSDLLRQANGVSYQSDEALSETQRQWLGQRWAELGLMEHASIAAFARFTLQLLHLGAPAALVEEAQRAMSDETEHAKNCFGLARRYLGYAVGPGPLRMEQALQETQLADIVRLTVREGCIGETCAALEAAEAYEATLDPATKLVLGKIRQDEFRHAELAWKFVKWALTEGAANGEERARLRDIVSAEFAAAARELSVLPSHGVRNPDFDTLAHGLVPPSMLPVIRRAALLDVVLPCAQRLLQSLASGERSNTSRQPRPAGPGAAA